MSNVAKIIFEKGRAKLICGPDLLDALRMESSVPNKAAKYSKFAPAIYCPITPAGSFNVGLVNYLVKKHDAIEFQIDESVRRRLNPLSISNVSTPSNTKFEYRDYQLEAITTALSVGRGVIQLPTSAGKSLVIYGIIQSIIDANAIEGSVLLLTPNIQLVSQLTADLIEYGFDKDSICMFSSFNKYDLNNKKVIVSNRQWIEKHNSELCDIDIDAVIVDECHSLRAGNGVSKFVNALKTNIRIGLTGTLPDNIEDVWSIFGVLGDVIISREIKKLQEDGWIANIDIVSVQIKHEDRPRSVFNEIPKEELSKEDIMKDYKYENDFIETSEKSLNVLSGMASKLPGNTLLLFDHTEHGKKLFEMIDGKEKHFINGEIDLNVREEARARMEGFTGIVIVANTACFGTGINIKNINNIILAVNGAASTKILQSIGRGLRLCDNKVKLTLIDTHHNCKYSSRHYIKRKKIYSDIYKINPKTKVL